MNSEHAETSARVEPIVSRLRNGLVYKEKRHSGDTRSDSSGSIDVAVTEELMATAAELLDEAHSVPLMFRPQYSERARELIDEFGKSLPEEVWSFLLTIELCRANIADRRAALIDRIANSVDHGIRKMQFDTYDDLLAVIESAVDG